MAGTPAPLCSQDHLVPSWPRTWGWPSSHPTSPTSSAGSHSPSLSTTLLPACSKNLNFQPDLRLLPDHGAPLAQSNRKVQSNAGRGQRQSASQREKLRMRHLAQALHALRHYLPPSMAPAGQNLTKIETLRLTIRYIGHLSELLGLSEETLARRGVALVHHCHLSPPIFGCCLKHNLAGERRQAVPASGSWTASPCCMREIIGRVHRPDSRGWASAPSCLQAGSPHRPDGVPAAVTGSWEPFTSSLPIQDPAEHAGLLHSTSLRGDATPVPEPPMNGATWEGLPWDLRGPALCKVCATTACPLSPPRPSEASSPLPVCQGGL